MEMRDLRTVVNIKISVSAGTVSSIEIPNDSLGVKLFSDKTIFFAVDKTPAVAEVGILNIGAFASANIQESRILPDGSQRKLNIIASEATDVLVEFFGK